VALVLADAQGCCFAFQIAAHGGGFTEFWDVRPDAPFWNGNYFALIGMHIKMRGCMRYDNRTTTMVREAQSGMISVAWGLTETSFGLEFNRRALPNRFDRVIGLEMWTTHEFAEAILPKLSRV
jgi:hypothetical protein